MSTEHDAERAYNLINDELLQRLIKSIRQDLCSRWSKTQPKDKDLREDLYFELRGISGIEQKLQATLDNGTFLKMRSK